VERIQRLERLEQERLDEKERREERRRQIIATGKPSGGRHDLVDAIEREPGRAAVPWWPWGPLVQLMRVLPPPLTKRFA